MLSRNRRWWIAAALTPVLAILVWSTIPDIPPFAAAKRVRQVTRLPLPLTASVLRAEVHTARFGAESMEEYEFQLRPEQFRAVAAAAAARSFRRLPSPTRPDPADTVGWYHEKGDQHDFFVRTVLDEASRQVRVLITVQ